MSRFVLPVLLALAAAPAGAAPVRVKELVDVRGVRENALLGYGIVVGLAGSGDSQMTAFTAQSVASMLGRLGVRIDPDDVRVRNVAAVVVTADLPAFTRPGARIDVTVSAMGDARSLAGGTLLMTPLKGPDGAVYALAQGPVQVGAYDARFIGARAQKNQPTSGKVPGGAVVEKSVVVDLTQGPLVLALRRPDFTTAARLAEAVNASLGAERAVARDAAVVEVTRGDKDPSIVMLLAALEQLEVEADLPARIVVSERTGTIVAGANVRLRPAVVAHGTFKVEISSAPVFSQPAPFTRDGTAFSERVSSVRADETKAEAKVVPATTTVEELAAALNVLGATPSDLISILIALKAAGAIDAELEVL